jgi:hypothetical protein
MKTPRAEIDREMPIFPYPEARDYLVKAVERWLPNDLSIFAEKLVVLHLDKDNFPMPIRVDKAAMVKALRAGESLQSLRQLITFEDTQTSAGIVRVMVRTHLNRSGINFVSRGFKSKTMAERVMGLFPVGIDPKTLVTWDALTSSWLAFALNARRQGRRDEKSNDLFSDKDIDALQRLSGIESSRYRSARDQPAIHNNWGRLVTGVYTGLKYLNDQYELDASKVWKTIDEASESARGVRNLINAASKSIDEYGPTLAGSFFADLGAARFVKDDVHVTDSIAAVMGADSSQVKGDLAFKVMQQSADFHGVTPRAVDKVMYLACSSNLYLFDFRLDKSQAALEKSKFLQFLSDHVSNS